MERYKLTDLGEGSWTITDIKMRVSVTFAEGDFNDSQKVEIDNPDRFAILYKEDAPVVIASILRGIGDWMRNNHYHLLFPAESDFRLTERERIGAMLRKAREAKGWTRETLETLTGIKPQNMWKIETGKHNASIDILSKVASALGLRLTLEEIK